MVANINPKTNIPYGTIYGSNIPELVDQIQCNGEDLSWKAAKEELENSLKSAIGEIDGEEFRQDNEDEPYNMAALIKAIEEAVKGVITNYSEYRADRIVDAADAHELADCLIDGKFGEDAIDYNQLADELFDAGLNDCIQIDEPDYDYTLKTDKGDVVLHQTWLGGAILIYVFQSPWIIGCRPCSPCVPNAGDIDSVSRDGEEWDGESGYICYCLPPDELPDDWEGPQPILYEDYLKAHS